MLRLLFLTYPIISNVAFQAFSCHNFYEDGQWLKADVSIECIASERVGADTSEHRQVVFIATLAILIYPVGVLVLYGTLLAKTARSILSNVTTPLSIALDFLYREYEVGFFWCARRRPPSNAAVCVVGMQTRLHPLRAALGRQSYVAYRIATRLPIPHCQLRARSSRHTTTALVGGS